MSESEVSDAKVVAQIPPSKTGVTAKKTTGNLRQSKTAAYAAAMGVSANIAMGSGGNVYSPFLSTDYLEIPQSLHESWAYYRHFVDNEPFVGQAIDLRTIIPMSKVRISKPRNTKSKELAEAATRFCTEWAQRIDLLDRLMAINYERDVIGEVYIWCEDENPEMPDNITHRTERVVNENGDAEEVLVPLEDGAERAYRWLWKNYKGWTDIRCLPPESFDVRRFSFSKHVVVEMQIDDETRRLVSSSAEEDLEIVKSMPSAVVDAAKEGSKLRLNTDPYAGSFIIPMRVNWSDYAERGRSVLQRLIRTLVYRDKLRQAQTSIASRHMTPIRVVWGDDLSADQLEELRNQVDNALMDPDFSIITNYQVNWEEMGADQRLLDLNGEYDITNQQMFAGFGITEGLLTGESKYSGDRNNLETVNERFIKLRLQFQRLVQEMFFRPMCYRMGFIEQDEFGNEIVVVPEFSFTRMTMRDTRDTFDALFNLYQKGSLDVETILELFNLDPDVVKERIERDLLTVNDPVFNEFMRGIYSDAGRKAVEESAVVEKLLKLLKLQHTPPPPDGGRYG